MRVFKFVIFIRKLVLESTYFSEHCVVKGWDDTVTIGPLSIQKPDTDNYRYGYHAVLIQIMVTAARKHKRLFQNCLKSATHSFNICPK